MTWINTTNNTNIWKYVMTHPSDDIVQNSIKDICSEYVRKDEFTHLYLVENKNLIFFVDIKD